MEQGQIDEGQIDEAQIDEGQIDEGQIGRVQSTVAGRRAVAIIWRGRDVSGSTNNSSGVGTMAGTAFLVALLWAGSAAAQDGADGGRQLNRLVDCPTAGLVEKGRFGVDLRLFPDGGVMGQLNAGIMRRLAIGISYGGTGIIGDDGIDWYPRVEAAVRYRLVEESAGWPAFLLGFETQGYGAYQDAGDRYQIKSKGLFLALSKNYMASMGQFGIHGGLNISREDGDDEGLSGWLGLDKTINEELAVAAEYDFALNDNDDDALGSGRGYLNVGIQWSAVPSLSIGVMLKNVFRNGDEDRGTPGGPDGDMSRELSVRYTETF